MSYYCLKCKKTKNINSKLLKTNNGKQWYYQNVPFSRFIRKKMQREY